MEHLATSDTALEMIQWRAAQEAPQRLSCSCDLDPMSTRFAMAGSDSAQSDTALALIASTILSTWPSARQVRMDAPDARGLWRVRGGRRSVAGQWREQTCSRQEE
eukprot:2414267-Prorocentrum_lima.AAC.1